VNYTLSGTATKGTDYNNLTGTVSFAAGAATALVNINTIDDTLAEGSETVILTLGTGTGYTVGATNTATVTIADNEVLPDLAGNTLATARVVTVGATATTFTDFVGGNNVDPDDYYKFTLANASTVNLTLNGLNGNAGIKIVQDLNNNGAIDFGETLAYSYNSGTTAQSISEALNVGTYFIHVGYGNTNYNLTVSATPLDNAGNTLTAARNINLNSPQTIFEFVGSIDVDDYYRFSLNTTNNFKLSLDGLSANADVQLIRDANNNNVVDSGELLVTIANTGTTAESITRSLSAGTYFIRVYPAATGVNTNYILGVSATPANTAPTNLDFNTTKVVYNENETVSLTGEVFDADGITTLSKIDFWLQEGNNGTWRDITDATTFTQSGGDNRWASFSYTLNALDVLFTDVYQLKAIAYDKSGATSETVIKQFKVNTPPNKVYLSSLDSSYYAGKAVNLSGFVSDFDGFSDVVKIDLSLQKDGGDWNSVDSIISFDKDTNYSWSANFSYQLTGLSLGSYVLKARAYDQAGAYVDADVQSFKVVEIQKYTFTYNYGNGDYYDGYVYAENGKYNVGGDYDFTSTLNEAGFNGKYVIKSAETVGTPSDLGKVYVTKYYDADSSQQSYVPDCISNGFVSGYSYLGSEDDTIADPYRIGNISFGKDYDEADIVLPKQYSFKYEYGNGDYYEGYVYADQGTYTVGQYYDPAPTVNGQYYISSAADVGSNFKSGDLKEVYLTNYYDGDTSQRSFTPKAPKNGYPSGYNLLGSEDDYIYDAAADINFHKFSPSLEADVPEAIPVFKYSFRYNYGNGDYYDGFVYARENTYTMGQIIDPKTTNTEAGTNGNYTITAIADSTNKYGTGSVYVTTYYDGDNSKVSFTLNQTYSSGYKYLGSEKRTIFLDRSSNGNIVSINGDGTLFDSFGEDNYEADFSVVKKFTFRYDYGNGDYYDGYVYADQNKYKVGQYYDFKLTNNEAGFNGKYYISAVANEGKWTDFGKVYVTNYYDGDNSKLSFTLNQTYPSSYNYLGTEKDAVSLDSSDNGNIVSIKGNSQLFGSFGEDNYEADFAVVKKFTFRYDYGNGDYYDGYVYADQNKYTVGQYYDFKLTNNEAGFNGKYYISAVTTEGNWKKLKGVYVTNYYDGDRSKQNYIPYYTSQGVTTGYNDLGSEEDYISEWGFGNKFGNDYEEADVVIVAKYSFRYNYGNGDYYDGFVYAEKYTYQVGTTFDPNPNNNEAGFNGKYSINAVEITGKNYDLGKVYVTNYYDGDRSKQNYIPLSYRDGLVTSYDGLGTEYDYISGFNSINKFGNDYDEADVSVTTKYSFTYNYNDGDSYSGYIYAEDGTYAINQSIGGAAGTYKITGAVVSGSKYDINKVYVTSYYDGNFSKQTYIPYSYTKGYASSYSGFGGEWDDFYINNILISFTYIQSGGNSSNFYRINVGDSVYEALSRTAAYQRKAPSDNNGSAKMTVGLVLSGFAGVPDNEYKVDQVFEDTSKGFFAVGLVANNPSSGRPPVLVIRGTANLYGAFDDTHPNGVGWEQFYSRRDQIVTWLNAVTTNAQKNPSFAAPDITGHSLGGAIAQRFGAYYSSTGGKIGEIITVNSPGIDSATINTANLSNIGNITYYIATGDPVSLAGKFLPGNWSRLAWNSPDSYLIGDYLLAKHTNPNRLTSNHVNEYWYSSTNNLNSPSFSYWQYNQPDWLTFNLSIAAVAPVVSLLTGGTLGTVISSLPVILSSRQTTEASRTLVGQALRAVIDYNRDPLGSLRNSILNYAKNYAQEAWDTFKNLDANEWAAIAKANPAMWAAMSKWTPDAWKSANSWTSDRWNVVKSWTSEAWNKTTSWTGDQWNKTKNWTTDQFKQGAQIGKEIIKSVDPRTWW
jgi:pimeloyl-ACP methyl ester carboxylesterase